MGGQAFSVGKLITYQLYWNMLNNSYKVLINIVTQFTRAAGAAQRVLTLMDNLPDISHDDGEKIQSIVGKVEFRNVHFHYQMRPDQPVLRGIDLVIPASTTCAFVGRSGGGKSTMVHLLLRFYAPKKGAVLLDDKDLKDLHMASWHRHVGVVAQVVQRVVQSVKCKV
jgi:ATP-binding cassette subfamily B protein